MTLLRALPAFLALSGCAACRPGDTDTYVDSDYRCAARVSDTVNTVLLVEIEGPPGAAEITYGMNGALDHHVPARPIVEGETLVLPLLGMPSLADVTWNVAVDGTDVCGGTDSTKNLPADLAEFEVQLWEPEDASDVSYVLFAMTGTRQGLYMVDRAGRIVWYRIEPDMKVQWVQPYWDRGTALFNNFDPVHVEDLATISRTDAEANRLYERRTVEGHHTFSQFETDTFGYLRRDKRTWFNPERDIEQPVVGDAIVEQDPDGNERVLFDAWDWLPVRTTPEFYRPFYRDAADWTHANSVHWDPVRNTTLTTFSNLGTMVEVDREAALPLRWFGNDGEDRYGYADGTRRMQLPHDPRWTGEDTFTVFITDDSVGRSGVIEYRIDEANHELVEIWSYGFHDGEPIHRAFFLGQAWRQPNGNTLIKWAQTGRMVEITPDKRIIWDLRVGSGGVFQEADLITDLYEERP